MIDIPNVKLMDAFVFIAAFLFGLEVGLGTAISIWAVYGFINPYGQDDLTLLLFLMTGECLYAIAGTLLSRTSVAQELMAKQIQAQTINKQSVKYGMHPETGRLSRIKNRAGDLLNNARRYGRMSLLIGMITGVPFAILHEASNLVFFATVVPPAIAAAKRAGLHIQQRIT